MALVLDVQKQCVVLYVLQPWVACSSTKTLALQVYNQIECNI